MGLGQATGLCLRYAGVVVGCLALIAPFIGVPLLIIRHWDSIRSFFVWLWDKVGSIFQAGWGKVKPIVDAVVGAGQAIGGVLGFGGGSPPSPGTPPAGPALALSGAGGGFPTSFGGGGLPGIPTAIAGCSDASARRCSWGASGGRMLRIDNIDVSVQITAPGADSEEIRSQRLTG